MSIVIALVILYGTWSLFTQSLKLALDGVPEGVDFNKLKEQILGIEGVKDFKHLHIWALSTTENALTAHLQVDKSLSLDHKKIMAIVAFIGIIINSLTAYFFMKDKDADLNVKGAYLHMAADALVSLGVVIAGVVIIFTNWFWLDSV